MNNERGLGMLLNESLWFQQKIEQYVNEGDTIINVGSSTAEFRERIQPHIHENLFLPLEGKNAKVYHVDLKQAEGVDLAGDLMDPGFYMQLKGLEPKGIICSNLLEHLENRKELCGALVGLLSYNSYIFASVPKNYPSHLDPIDTMFRPNVAELVAQFPGVMLVEGEILECGTHRDMEQYYSKAAPSQWIIEETKRTLKMFMPFYKPRKWIKLISGRDRPHPDTPISITCVVLKKRCGPATVSEFRVRTV